MPRDDFLDAAVSIGHRLAGQASWDGAGCTWEIKTSDRSSHEVRRSQAEQAGGALYQGTCGIAWFLAMLYRATGENEIRRTAEGALRHALTAGNDLPTNNFGFHSGRVGIAWVAARMADALDREDYLEESWRLLAPLVGDEHRDYGSDVIGGAAGAIPALLELGVHLGRDEPTAMARRLGDGLIARAHREPDGWSWATVGGSAARHLNGLAHGASGFGLALLELYRATGEGAYRFAAEMAFLYERQFFDRETCNWPDLRHKAISDLMYYGRDAELRQAAAAGTLPQYRLTYMAAWCHGSPGIGLARLRAYELTGQDLYRQEAEAALRSTLQSISEDRLLHDNYSLCHGISGNCELPLLAAEILGEPEWRRSCERAAEVGLARFERANQSWPCGTLNSETDPSLLLGEAGIGLFLLRLAVPDIPSVLLLRPRYEDTTADRAEVAAEGFAELARHSVEEYFGQALRAFDRLAEAPGLPTTAPEEAPLDPSPAAAAYEHLRRWTAEQPEERRTLLEDAFKPERLRFELSRDHSDFTAEFLRGLVRPETEAVEWSGSPFQLAPGARLVNQRRDWQAWLTDEDPPAEPELEDTTQLLYLRDNRIHPQQVGPLAALVLAATVDSATLAEIVRRVAAALDGGADIDVQDLTAKVLPQLQQLYQAGFVDLLASTGG